MEIVEGAQSFLIAFFPEITNQRAVLPAFPHLSIIQLTAVLAGVDDWQFDAFRLEAASGGRPLSCLAFFLMKRTEMVERFHLEETKLANFLMVWCGRCAVQ